MEIVNFLFSLFGFGVALVLIIFIGFIDVFLLRKPQILTNNLIKLYAIISAWEFLFFLIGVILGLLVRL